MQDEQELTTLDRQLLTETTEPGSTDQPTTPPTSLGTPESDQKLVSISTRPVTPALKAELSTSESSTPVESSTPDREMGFYNQGVELPPPNRVTDKMSHRMLTPYVHQRKYMFIFCNRLALNLRLTSSPYHPLQ